MKEIILPSGAKLKIGLSPFAVAKGLLQAVLKELKGIQISGTMDLAALYKDLACAGFISDEVEKALGECFKRCTVDYGAGDLKIDKDTFEAAERRGDFILVVFEVLRENLTPFLKSLFAEFSNQLKTNEKAPQ